MKHITKNIVTWALLTVLLAQPIDAMINQFSKSWIDVLKNSINPRIAGLITIGVMGVVGLEVLMQSTIGLAGQEFNERGDQDFDDESFDEQNNNKQEPNYIRIRDMSNVLEHDQINNSYIMSDLGKLLFEFWKSVGDNASKKNSQKDFMEMLRWSDKDLSKYAFYKGKIVACTFVNNKTDKTIEVIGDSYEHASNLAQSINPLFVSNDDKKTIEDEQMHVFKFSC